MNIKELKSWLAEIKEAMDVRVGIDEPNGILEKLNNLSSLLSLNAQCVALSEKFYNEKLGELCLAKEYKSMQATEKKMLFASLASEEIYVMQLAEKQSKDVHYCLESLRSMLSYLKTELVNIK